MGNKNERKKGKKETVQCILCCERSWILKEIIMTIVYMLMKEERKIGVFFIIEEVWLVYVRFHSCCCSLLFSWTECCKPTQGKFMKEKEVLSKKLSFYLFTKKKERYAYNIFLFTIQGSSAILIIKNYNIFCVLFFCIFCFFLLRANYARSIQGSWWNYVAKGYNFAKINQNI